MSRNIRNRVGEELAATLARRLGVDPAEPPSPSTPAPLSDATEGPAWTPWQPPEPVEAPQPKPRATLPILDQAVDTRTVKTAATLDTGARLPELAPAQGGDRVRVLAEILSPQRCRLHVGHAFAQGQGWWFSERAASEAAPLAQAIFEAVPELSALLVDDRTLVLVTEAARSDWRSAAERVAEVLRAHLAAGAPALPAALTERIPDEAEIRSALQTVLAEEINPGVAAHEGEVSLERVRGNSVWVRMGGGCQGCSAADATLSGGVESAFRRAVPSLAGVHDATDHAAGESPFFSRSDV